MFKEFIQGVKQQTGSQIDDRVKEMAAAVLMVETARGDQKFTEEEQSSIKNSIMAHFGLDAAAAEALVKEAVKRLRLPYADSIFSRAIKEAFELEERKEILGLVWKVAASDGHIARVESLIIEQLGKDMGIDKADIVALRPSI